MCGILEGEVLAHIIRAFWGGKVIVCVILEMCVNDGPYYKCTCMFCKNVIIPM